VFTPVSVWCAAVWGAIRKDAVWLWSQLQAEAGVADGEMAPSWLILTADTISESVARLNMVPDSAKSVLDCFDVEQYYTNVPHQDLLRQLRYVLGMVSSRRLRGLPGAQRVSDGAVWQLHLIVYKKELKFDHEWLILTEHDAQRKRSDKCLVLKIGDGANGPMQLAEFVIMNAYFKLGDQMFRQLIGIPMGANPSPAFADLYLVAYEIQFMLQFLHSGGPYIRAFLQWFSFIHRFQDDVFVAHCKYIHDGLALYVESFFQLDGLPHPRGFHGLYPGKFLNIAHEQCSQWHVLPDSPANMVHHQDVAIYLRVVKMGGQPVPKWQTRVYNKSIKFEAAGVQFVYYPDVSSLLSTRCKYGIVLSQSNRFVRRCTIPHDFFEAAARLIHYMVACKHYRLDYCLEFYVQFCNHRLGIYGFFKLEQLVRPVRDAVNRLLSS